MSERKPVAGKGLRENGAAGVIQGVPTPRRSVVYPGEHAGLVLTALGMAVSVILLGLTMPYYNKAASDMVSVYEALLYNSRLPQEFLVYPALIDRVLLGLWLDLLHAAGLIPASRFEPVAAAASVTAFDAQWQGLVEAGRVYALLTGIACVTAFVVLVRRWIGVWQIAHLAGIAFAYSSGVALGFRILRPEMLAATLVVSALLLTMIAAKEHRPAQRTFLLAGAGFLVALAILEKVQSIIPALALLPLALAFGAPFAGPLDERKSGSPGAWPVAWSAAWRWTGAIAALAVLALWPAVAILAKGVAAMPASTATSYAYYMGSFSGRYQVMTAAAIVAGMALYARIWRVPVAETLAAMAAVGAGLACGFDLLYLQSSLNAVIAVANPIEHLQAYAAGPGEPLLAQSSLNIIQKILSAIGESLAIHTFFLHPIHRPTLIVEWLAWAGMVYALRNGRQQMALQIFLLLGCAIAQDALFSLRQVKVYYLPYSDAPVILAGALALSQFSSQLRSLKIERATLALIAVYIVWGHAQPALAVYSRHDRGKVCGIVVQFTKRLTIPYCDPDPKT